MPAAPAIRIVVRNYNDTLLQRNISQMSAATGRTVKEETRTVFKGMVRDAIIYTPPASADSTGHNAKKQGERAIARDLRRMGFNPVVLKGHRTITQAFGRPISPVTIPTRENPKFAEPDAFHLLRLQAKRGGRVSRGGKQAYYVSKARFNAMVKRLYLEVGHLASGWLRAARQLGVAVPAWIARFDGSRGTEVHIVETTHKLSMVVVNHFPDTAASEAREMIRRLALLKKYAINRLKRQLPYVLKARVRAAKR